MTCLLNEFSGFLSYYINTQHCVGLSVVVTTETPLRTNQEEYDIVTQFRVATLA